jgi:hypothetical protein
MPKIFALSERKRRNRLGNGTIHEAHMRFRFWRAGFEKILCSQLWIPAFAGMTWKIGQSANFLHGIAVIARPKLGRY